MDICFLPCITFDHVFTLSSFPSNHHLAMDSVPQELIDAIIDNVPRSSLPSCSLVAKRWRRKSQRRVLSTICSYHEDQVNRWCTDIPRDSDGISSYVRRVKLKAFVAGPNLRFSTVCWGPSAR
jgi:hypothetical protein